MRALILAAGRGTRLGLDDDQPKCLATLGRTTLLDRYLTALTAHGLDASIVVGHGADRIRAHLAGAASAPRLIDNPRYHEGSVVSLLAGLDAIGPGPLLLMDGDVAFSPSILETLLRTPAANALSVDLGTEFTDEQYMAGVNAGRVHALRRGPVPGHEAQGEWIGFARLEAEAVDALHAKVRSQVAAQDTRGGYEDALATLLPRFDVRAIGTAGAPWVEIDFVDDLQRARDLFA